MPSRSYVHFVIDCQAQQDTIGERRIFSTGVLFHSIFSRGREHLFTHLSTLPTPLALCGCLACVYFFLKPL